MATELMGTHQANDPRAMPLNEYITEVIEILKTQPEAMEICVKRVYPLRFASEQGHARYDVALRGLNSAMTSASSSQ